MKHLVSWNVGGLGNRLRSLVSVIRLASYFDRKPLVCWPANNHCNSRFSDLFTGGVEEIEASEIPLSNTAVVEGAHFGFPKRNKLCAISDCCAETLVIKDCYKWILTQDEVFDGLCPAEYNADWTQMPRAARAELQAILKALRPHPRILATINEFWERNMQGKNIIGVHVRRTDKTPDRSPGALQDSSRLLVEALQYILAQHPHTDMFLCSDSQDTEASCRSHWPKRCLIRKKQAYDELHDGEIHRCYEAVVEGLIDMYLLSRSKQIWGSHNSTFSSLAACFNDSSYHALPEAY